MARNVNGVNTILAASRLIARMVKRFGVEALASATTPEMATAVGALLLAVAAFEALDDFPGQVDRTPGPIDGDG
jgi:hypothetical protein